MEGKLSKYNKEFNTLEGIRSNFKQFKAYAIQDSKALLKVLRKAQAIYFKEYEVDIAKAYSTANLSLTIFRKKFLKIKIPVLSQLYDSMVRESYYGGATDYYKKSFLFTKSVIFFPPLYLNFLYF